MQVSIFDTRMMGGGRQHTVATHDVPDGVIQFAWCAKVCYAICVTSVSLIRLLN
jgi:hypothetical protein